MPAPATGHRLQASKAVRAAGTWNCAEFDWIKTQAKRLAVL